MISLTIRLFVTDLDNTLYDWVSSFVPAFYDMVHVAAPLLSVDEEQLLDELKAVHQRYGNSEQPFALLETPAAHHRYPDLSRADRARALDPAFHAFNKTRRKHLQPYPGVAATLEHIHRAGCAVVAHTEAAFANALYRLEALNLSGYFDRLYAPEGVGISHPYPEQLQQFEAVSKKLCRLPAAHRKPNPVVLDDIRRDFAVSAAETLYVGDSMSRDVLMARLAGTLAAHAEYGTRYDPALWQRLVRVTHWTDQDIERDLAARSESAALVPDIVLQRFPNLLDPVMTVTGLARLDFRAAQPRRHGRDEPL